MRAVQCRPEHDMFLLPDFLRAERPTRGAMLMTTRPNILLITSDQQRADCFGFENRHIKTPHLDLLWRRRAHVLPHA